MPADSDSPSQGLCFSRIVQSLPSVFWAWDLHNPPFSPENDVTTTVPRAVSEIRDSPHPQASISHPGLICRDKDSGRFWQTALRFHTFSTWPFCGAPCFRLAPAHPLQPHDLKHKLWQLGASPSPSKDSLRVEIDQKGLPGGSRWLWGGSWGF